MKQRRGGYRKALKLLTAIAALLVLAGIAVKYWIGPSLVRSRLEWACSQFFSQPMHIAGVSFSFFGPISANGLELRDENGDEHIRVSRLLLVRKDLSPLDPVITDVVADGLDLCIRRTAGRSTSPIRVSRSSDLLGRYVDLQSVRVADASVSVYEDGEYAGGLQLAEALFSQEDGGTYSLKINGQTVVSELKTSAGRSEAPGGPKAREFSAALLGGAIKGSYQLTRGQTSDQFSCDVLVQGDGVNLGRLSDILGNDAPEGMRKLTGRFEFHTRSADLDDVRGEGKVTLSDVDALSDPLSGPVLKFLGGQLGRARPASRMRASFTLGGATVTLDDAELTDALRIMRVEEGGTINLRTRAIDLYVTTLELRGVSNLVTQIPVVQLATSLSNKLTRVHVTGTWDKAVFRKEPVEDVSSATLELLQDTLTDGVLLPGVVPRGVGELLQSLRSNVPPSPQTTSAPAD